MEPYTTTPRPARSRAWRTSVAIATMLALGAVGCGAEPAAAPNTVSTPGGVLRGNEHDGVREFRGIRYAQPPVGPLRWAPPVPTGPWDGTAAATEPGPRCPQRTLDGDDAARSEDCLFLNVTTPRDQRPGELLPVVLWWHGGGFMTGSGAEYGARRLAVQGRVVVVTVNYRLGVLGYLGLPGLPGSGSFGFADQVQSLRWARENIASFGGNPDTITVAGESAGGLAACALLTSPELAALQVSRVVVMSGACSLRWPAGGVYPAAPAQGPFAPVSAVQADGVAAAAELGCSGPGTLQCMRDQPVAALLGQTSRFARLAYGSDLLPADPAVALASAGSPSVPVLYGGNRDEVRSFVRRVVRNRPDAYAPPAYSRLLADAFGADAGAVDREYPLSDFAGSGAHAWSTIVSDAAWSCPTLRDAQALAARAPTFSYTFTRPDGPRGADGLPTGGFVHGAELPLLFERERQPMGPGQEELSRLVIQYWSSFARTGRPEAPSGPRWDPVAAGGPVRPMQLGVPSAPPTDSAALHRCDFWGTIRF